MTPEQCTWTTDVWADDACYETSCGKSFQLTPASTLAEHEFKFCVYCGKPINEVRYDRYADDDES